VSAAVEQIYASLEDKFRGDLLRPQDPEFAQARVIWNGMVARTPGLIARCASTTDVQAAVLAGVEAGIKAAVRCGGHSLPGYSTCEGGLVIDLSKMRDVAVDAKARRARFAGGCLLGSVDAATQQHGLVFPSGVVSHTGAAGLVLGGGFGWLTRLHGLSCDHVEGFTLVTADGSVLRADAHENADLFWALRGGGGNFGVVTEFDVRLHPLRSVVLGEGFSGENEISSVLRRWRDYMPESPDNLRWSLSLRLAPLTENVPPEIRGCPVVAHAAVWAGDLDEGTRCIERVLSSACSPGTSNRVVSFLSLQTMADHEFPHGRRYYTKSGYFKTLDDASIDRMVAALADILSPDSQIELAYLGGAPARVPSSDTAFGDRSSPYVINLLGNWSGPADDDANVAWVRKLFEDLRPAMTPGVYINFMSGDEDDRVTEAYRDHWDRLISIKSRYDPGNFFQLNQNIPVRRSSSHTAL